MPSKSDQIFAVSGAKFIAVRGLMWDYKFTCGLQMLNVPVVCEDGVGLSNRVVVKATDQ